MLVLSFGNGGVFCKCDHEGVINGLGKQSILLVCFKRLFSKLPVSSMCSFIVCITNCTCVKTSVFQKPRLKLLQESQDKTIGRQ